MKRCLLSLFIAFPIFGAFADEVMPNCLHGISTLSGQIAELNKEITSCGYNKGLAELEKNQDDQRKYIYEKLAEKLATKLIQSSEETALLTNYFNANDDDLLMKDSPSSEKIKKQCSLSAIKETEQCGNNPKGQYYDYKMSLLKKMLNPRGTVSNFGNDLYGIMANKFVKNMGIKNSVSNGLSCPLDGDVSGFILKSQIDDLSALDIVKGANGSKETFEESLNSYAQLKFIKDAGPTAIDKFKNYLLNIPKNSSPKEYIAKFFKDKENQKKFFAPTLANECESINRNINNFLCADLDDLGSLKNKVSMELFNKLDVAPMDDQYEIDFQNDPVALRAYGFQCLSQAKNKLLLEKERTKEHKLDDWFEDFTKNTRPLVSDDKDSDQNSKFCEKYTCTSPDSQKTVSCMKGGPLSARDFYQMSECPSGKSCNTSTLKAFDYLESLEKIQTKMSPSLADNSTSQSTPDQIKKAKSELPDFAENYLGLEGSLIALGKPVTPITIAEKKEDFKERKLNSEPPKYQPPTPSKTEYANNNQTQQSNEMASIVPSENLNARVATNSNSSFAPTIVPEYSRPIEGIRSKKKKKVESSYWMDDIPDVTPKKNEDDSKVAKKEEETTKTIANNDSSFNKNEFEDYKRNIERELSANRNKLSSVSNELARTQQDMASQRAEMERKIADLERKQAEMKNVTEPKEVAQVKAYKKESDSLRAELANKNRAPASVAASGDGVIVTTDKLKTLKEEELQKLGVDIEQSFVIAIKVKEGNNEKLVNVPVIRHTSKGKSYLIPRYEGKNDEIMKAIEKSPLFKDFILEVKSKMKAFTGLRDLIKGA